MDLSVTVYGIIVVYYCTACSRFVPPHAPRQSAALPSTLYTDFFSRVLHIIFRKKLPICTLSIKPCAAFFFASVFVVVVFSRFFPRRRLLLYPAVVRRTCGVGWDGVGWGGVTHTRFIEAKEGGSGIAVMVLRSTGGEHEAASSPYRHVDADTPKSVISADRFLVACGTRPVRYNSQ